MSIWADLLSLKEEDISITANFFALGGHSLLATRLASSIRKEFDVELALHVIFEKPTIIGLSDALLSSNNTLTLPQLVAHTRNGHLPLSFAQQRLWLVDQLGQGSTQYNIPGAYELQGPLNVDAFKQA
ncbi:phosphopantetheine-binding protein, partial [Pseudoalteromonas holothuriae]|uniref:phosphopantetheine-binding protein n=1 Tax=Pseudoalteromonas holothuriae TaxID=2963714 RepID=UPI0021C19997